MEPAVGFLEISCCIVGSGGQKALSGSLGKREREARAADGLLAGGCWSAPAERNTAWLLHAPIRAGTSPTLEARLEKLGRWTAELLHKGSAAEGLSKDKGSNLVRASSDRHLLQENCFLFSEEPVIVHSDVIKG